MTERSEQVTERSEVACGVHGKDNREVHGKVKRKVHDKIKRKLHGKVAESLRVPLSPSRENTVTCW